jgi:hypothetical protein
VGQGYLKMTTISATIGTYGKSIIRDSLIYYLDASLSQSYPGSGTTWSDLSGGGYNGTLATPTFDSPYSFSFNGTSDKVTSNIPSTAITNVSIQAWANVTTSTKGTIIKLGNNSGGYAIGIGSGNFETAGSNFLGLYPAIRWIDPAQTFTTGWHLFTMTLSAASVCQLYYDATSLTTPTGGNPNAPTTSISLGECTGDLGSGRYFSGKIAVALMYSKTLSATEVTQNYNALRSRFGI